jgi:ribosomal protein S18 acetylase RimI-like enzyme
MRGAARPAGGGWRVEPVDPLDPAMARRIHAVWAEAAAQEATLLGAPLPSSGPASLAGAAAFVLGALAGDELLGVLALGPGGEAGGIAIGTLVVLPAWQRHGIGRALLADALRRADARPGTVVTVVTAMTNTPALSLYRACGFVEQRRGVIESAAGGDGLPVLMLRRPAAA